MRNSCVLENAKHVWETWKDKPALADEAKWSREKGSIAKQRSASTDSIPCAKPFWGDKSCPKKKWVWYPSGALVSASGGGMYHTGWDGHNVRKASVGGASGSGSWEASTNAWGDSRTTHEGGGSSGSGYYQGQWQQWPTTDRDHSGTGRGGDWQTTDRDHSGTGQRGVCTYEDYQMDGDVEDVPIQEDYVQRDWLKEGAGNSTDHNQTSKAAPMKP